VSRERFALITGFLFLSLLTACATAPMPDSAPRSSSVPSRLPGDAVPREEPRSRYGNGPYYKVYGETYKVLDSSYAYQQRGVASWYGKKFHGRMTSSQEPYDMYAMTAAHKTLALGSGYAGSIMGARSAAAAATRTPLQRLKHLMYG